MIFFHPRRYRRQMTYIPMILYAMPVRLQIFRTLCIFQMVKLFVVAKQVSTYEEVEMKLIAKDQVLQKCSESSKGQL